jgi:hypothetical protein
VSCLTLHEPAQIVDGNGWQWGVVASCAIAEIIGALYGAFGPNPPCLGMIFRSDGAVLSGVRYVGLLTVISNGRRTIRAVRFT